MQENLPIFIFLLIISLVGILYSISFYRNPEKWTKSLWGALAGPTLDIFKKEKTTKIGGLISLFVFSALFLLTLNSLEKPVN